MTDPTRLTPPALAGPLTEEAVQALAAWSAERGSEATFQALLAASASAVRSARATVLDVEAASLSLAQSQASAAIAVELATTAESLDAALNENGACLIGRPSGPVAALRQRLPALTSWRARFDPPAPRPTWLAATGRSIEALGETADHLGALGDGQPDPSPSRQLAHAVAARLRHHRDGLVDEVARLLD